MVCVGGRWVDILGEEPGKKVFSQLRKNRPKFIDFLKKAHGDGVRSIEQI